MSVGTLTTECSLHFNCYSCFTSTFMWKWMFGQEVAAYHFKLLLAISCRNYVHDLLWKNNYKMCLEVKLCIKFTWLHFVTMQHVRQWNRGGMDGRCPLSLALLNFQLNHEIIIGQMNTNYIFSKLFLCILQRCCVFIHEDNNSSYGNFWRTDKVIPQDICSGYSLLVFNSTSHMRHAKDTMDVSNWWKSNSSKSKCQIYTLYLWYHYIPDFRTLVFDGWREAIT